MGKFLASIIDFSNHDVSMDKVLTPTEKIKKILKVYNETKGIID
jgi:ribose-phosphate pyrophosphokinase